MISKEFRKAALKKGFSETRILTNWHEIVGPSLGEKTRPIRIRNLSSSLGSVLTLLCDGVNAPIIQMEIPKIIKRVNASFGYPAIQRITLTQTAPRGFGPFELNEEEDAFDGQADDLMAERQDPETRAALDPRLSELIAEVGDPALRDALERLGRNLCLDHAPSNPE